MRFYKTITKLKKPSSLALNSATIGLVFMSPWILGFILFKLIPILAALGFSFTNFYMLEPAATRFVGLKNYLDILHDAGAGAGLFGSIGNFLFIVPLQMVAALALAVTASSGRLRNKLLMRTLFFLPSIIPAIAILSIMRGLADPNIGWINRLILEPLNLPSSSLGSLFPFVLALWSIGPTFIIMLSAIQSIPTEIIEAARVDGAGPIIRLFSIVLPMISPAIFFSLAINMTNAFGGVVLLDRGMPFNSSLSPMESYITYQMFSLGRLGYASALAWIMFLVIMVIIVAFFRSARYWVYFPMKAIMKKSKYIHVSTLGLRLWEFTGTAFVNLFVFMLLMVYLSPLSYMIVTSLETHSQLQDRRAPLWPAQAVTYPYQGTVYDVYSVPTSNGVRALALVKPTRTASDFIDPNHPDAGLIHWQGNWRSLYRVYAPSLTLDNLVQVWNSVKYIPILGNTMFVVFVSGIGVLCSSIAVAYGMSRFRIPSGNWLFLLIIATIMIPDSILVVPSFVIFTRVLGWNGSYLPLIVPPFFGSAVYIFLLRQKFKSIPRDLDEAAMLDGAGPLRILVSIILPQSIPIVTTVALLHFFNMWNELRISSLYLGIRPDLQTMAFTGQAAGGFGSTPEILQTGTLIFLIAPVVMLLISQRFFMQDMIVTGLEK